MPTNALVELGAGLDTGQVGGKAATLGRLAAAGLPVPPGFVVTAAARTKDEDLEPALVAAAGRLGPGPYAVRSSGTAEDLADASYAGLYETFLNAGPDDLARAVAECFAAATAERVMVYRDRHGGTVPDPAGDAAMAVLVQQMVDAEVAGVAFTANPVTGARDEVVVTATAGLGEGLVSGETVGEEWIVRDRQAERTRAEAAGDLVLDTGQALAIAEFARRVEDLLGGPQDIEWAIADGRVWLVQARPMTAVPEQVVWEPPGPGLWMRNFRLGEWLPEAMTPLFATWLLPALEGGYLDGVRAAVGAGVPFRYAVVHGWYYNAPPVPSLRLLLRAMVQSRGRMVRVLYNALVRVGRNPAAADRAVLHGLYLQWRDEQLPAYRRLVERGEQRADTDDSNEQCSLIDELGHAAGQYLFLLSIVGGSAWKIESCLTRFCRDHLAGVLDPYGGVQVLLRGLPGAWLGPPPPHAVHSLDWYRPTAGELAPADDGSGAESLAGRYRRLVTVREDAEATCRVALAGQPKRLARFEPLLEVAQRYAAIREEQTRDFTLAWPLLRRCVHRLGGQLRNAGVIAEVDDVFFLHRDELHRPATRLADVAAERRARWRRQCRLILPLSIGTAPRLIGDLIAKTVEAARPDTADQDTADSVVVGHPASGGRATGPVHVVDGPDGFAAFQQGEVLVTKTTTPAWTPLFARAAAVVTDGGSLAAHASLIAREYGIPAVVATGDASTRLRTGQPVTVDGTSGTVTIAAPGYQ